jgi:hypothetical protein
MSYNTSIDPSADCNLLDAAALPPRYKDHSMLGEGSNIGFLVLEPPDFPGDFTLATPIVLHLHMG